MSLTRHHHGHHLMHHPYARAAAVYGARALVHYGSRAVGHAWNHWRNHKTKNHGEKETVKREVGHIDSGVHSGVESVFLSLNSGLKPAKGFVKPTVSLRETYIINPSFSAIGKQTCFVLACVPTMQMVLGQNGIGPNYYAHNQCAASYDYGWAFPGPGQNGGSVDPVTDKILLKTVTLNIVAKNLTNTPLYMDLYFVIAKKDIVRVPNYAVPQTFNETCAVDMLNGNNFGKIDSMGVSSQSGTSYGYENIFQPFSKPGDFKSFRDMYTIKKVHHLSLDAASEESITTHIKMNKVFNYQKIFAQLNLPVNTMTTYSDANIGFQTLRGGVEVFAIIRGGVAKDSVGGSATQLVTFCQTEVGCIVTRTCHYALLKQRAKNNDLVVAQTTVQQATGTMGGNLQNLPSQDYATGTSMPIVGL